MRLCYKPGPVTKGHTKERGTWGLYARNYPASVKSRVDFDYLDQLTPDQKQWLADFADRFYGADHRGKPDEWPVDEKRKSYRDKNCANSDIFGQVEHRGDGSGATAGLDDLDDHPGLSSDGDVSIERTPEYLDSPEYKRARDEFRSHLSPERKPKNPKTTPALVEARQKLQKVVADGQSEE